MTLIFSSWAWNSQKTVGFDAVFFGDKFYKLRYIDLCVVQETVLHISIKGVEIVRWQRKKCIRQYVLIVERNVKFPSSLTQADLFTAEIAGLREEPRKEDSRLI